MRIRHTLTALAAGALILTACSSNNSNPTTSAVTTSTVAENPVENAADGAGVQLPEGMTTIEEITQALDQNNVAVRAKGRDADSGKMGTVDFYPNGDAAVSFGTDKYFQIDGIMYIQNADGSWGKISPTDPEQRLTLSATFFSDGDATYTVTENPDGYTVTTSYPADAATGEEAWEETNTFIVDENRTLTTIEYTNDGTTDIITVTYPTDLAPLEAPANATELDPGTGE